VSAALPVVLQRVLLLHAQHEHLLCHCYCASITVATAATATQLALLVLLPLLLLLLILLLLLLVLLLLLLLQQEDNTVIIDVRNAYESAIGHFNPPTAKVLQLQCTNCMHAAHILQHVYMQSSTSMYMCILINLQCTVQQSLQAL
jgi:hypothetical protein